MSTDIPESQSGATSSSVESIEISDDPATSTATLRKSTPVPLSSESSLISDETRVQRCQEILQYEFQTPGLLIRCLTHASAARTRLESNERLEFLGDSILGAVACEMLYELFPGSSEGELTRIKSVVVSRTTCARIIREMQLHPYLILGKGISIYLNIPNSILATAFEAIIGGIYLDGGYAIAREFVRRVIESDVTNAAESAIGVNYKSLFQQKSQRLFAETPIYRVLDEQGPDHNKCFQVIAVVGAREFSPAWGPSKKMAEQRAAHHALCELDKKPLPPEQIPDSEEPALQD